MKKMISSQKGPRTPPEVGAEEASSAIARPIDITNMLATNHCFAHHDII
jgi:hypothetical protein